MLVKTLSALTIQSVMIVLLVSAGCAQQPSSGPTDSQYSIQAGDVLKIEIFGTTLRQNVQVNCNGEIELAFIGSVAATHRTAIRLANEVTKRYSEILKDPRIVVSVTESQQDQPIHVTGAVHNPGFFHVKGAARLKDVLSLAGGSTEQANGALEIVRRSCDAGCKTPALSDGEGWCQQKITISYDDLRSHAETTPLVEPGDMLNVVGFQQVYVLGRVLQPRALVWQRDLTVTRVIAMAGGLVKRGNADEARVYRKDTIGCVRVIRVNLKAIRKKLIDDFELMDQDIVEALDKHPGTVSQPACPNPKPQYIIR